MPPPDAAAYVDPAAWLLLYGAVALVGGIIVAAGVQAIFRRERRAKGPERAQLQREADQDAAATERELPRQRQPTLVVRGEIRLFVECGHPECVRATELVADRRVRDARAREARGVDRQVQAFAEDVERVSREGWGGGPR